MKRLLVVGFLLALVSPARADVVFSSPLKIDLWPGRSWPGGNVRVTGIQLSVLNGGALPSADKPRKYSDAVGLHFGLLAASNSDLIGFRSGLVSGGRRLVGAEVSLFNYSERALGIQCGFSNLAGERLSGFQAGAINLAGDPLTGANPDSGCMGIQVGLVNFCGRNLKGIQVGVLNIALNSRALLISPGLNIGF